MGGIEIAAALPDACARIEDEERVLINYARSATGDRAELERRYGSVD